jgi:DNA-binding winged helix-turn-helix (wHTH) protein
MAWTIGRFTLDRQTRELRDDGNLIAIEARVFDFLVAIISHRDRVVSKEELVETVWSGRIVSDTVILEQSNNI